MLVEALEARNMVQVSEMILRAALVREESRRAHYRTDFPKTDNGKWLRNVVIRKDPEGMRCATMPPVMTRIRPAETGEAEG